MIRRLLSRSRELLPIVGDKPSTTTMTSARSPRRRPASSLVPARCPAADGELIVGHLLDAGDWLFAIMQGLYKRVHGSSQTDTSFTSPEASW